MDSAVEKKLIDIWADILEELDRKLMKRKKKEAIPTTRLNAYISEELSRPEQYTEKEVCNKANTIRKKGKAMYVTHQKKGETGRECTQDDVDLDMEAAEATWPNFKTFFGWFKNHPALGPGAVEDSSATPNVEPGPSAAAQTEHGEDATTLETSRPPSRAPIESVGHSDSASEEEEDIPMPSNRRYCTLQMFILFLEVLAKRLDEIPKGVFGRSKMLQVLVLFPVRKRSSHFTS